MELDDRLADAVMRVASCEQSGARELSLAGLALEALPESLGSLTQLTTLDLAGNQLTSVPESLGSLTQLTTLDLAGNQLTSVPESLGSLT
ncbi:leucine-rich repeat domain-containing protein, partial [Streptomyces globisporus]